MVLSVARWLLLCFMCVCVIVSFVVFFVLFMWCLGFFLFFFFSSRRRHTRCLSDWSSDVCSSDLGDHFRTGAGKTGRQGHRTAAGSREHLGQVCRRSRAAEDQRRADGERVGAAARRSEERRVGKECRSRGRTAYGNERERTPRGAS